MTSETGTANFPLEFVTPTPLPPLRAQRGPTASRFEVNVKRSISKSDDTDRVRGGANCEVCGLHIRRNTDLPRHMLVHATDKASLMFRCPVEGCSHSTLQKSNLQTHIRTHTRAKPYKCSESLPSGEPCDFSTADPSSLHRHRKRKHGYCPKPRKRASAAKELSKRPRERASSIASVATMGVDAQADSTDSDIDMDVESEESFGAKQSRVVSGVRLLHGDSELDEASDVDAEGEEDDEHKASESEFNLSLLANISSTRTTA
ncbi:Transcriptional repressor CTCF-like [Mycena indigotica]|uniref:Transcriptional repressor CTCF-like n=1 Tax=Mycena indigotica TaxID=2126181 RepID=A0A8H6WEN0_9AGAR|nr:Transcriptional repressor CTCF-like [Mycena indigotica]KAF7314987.1 Transcriptional repressor CTCF-like [Mycena indigotica]